MLAANAAFDPPLQSPSEGNPCADIDLSSLELCPLRCDVSAGKIGRGLMG